MEQEKQIIASIVFVAKREGGHFSIDVPSMGRVTIYDDHIYVCADEGELSYSDKYEDVEFNDLDAIYLTLIHTGYLSREFVPEVETEPESKGELRFATIDADLVKRKKVDKLQGTSMTMEELEEHFDEDELLGVYTPVEFANALNDSIAYGADEWVLQFNLVS